MSSLFDSLIDDAAVFPPGSATIPVALAEHRRLRRAPVARYIGPLLVPAARFAEWHPLLSEDPMPIGLIGAPQDVLQGYGAAVAAGLSATVVGVEAPVATDADSARGVLSSLRPLLALGIPCAVEIGRRAPVLVLESLADAAEANPGSIRAKFRTGGLGDADVPPAQELAEILFAAVGSGVPLKFTAGLHHAAAAPGRHGVLNLLVAVGAAQAGAGVDEVAKVLQVQEVQALAAKVAGIDGAAVRSVFTSFGCCGVLEPLGEVADAGLIPPLDIAELPEAVEGRAVEGNTG